MRAISWLLAAALLAAVHPAQAQRAWHLSGYGSSAVVMDCRDCGDEAGIIFRCRGLGRPAELSVPAVAVERRPSGRNPRLELFVDGLGMAYQAELESRRIGYVPRMFVRQDDPLIERLAAGSSLRVRFADASAELSLHGARAALAAFASQCAWSNARALAAPLAGAVAEPPEKPAGEAEQGARPGTVVTGPAPSADRPLMRWQYFAGGRSDPSRLVFGVAGTDQAVLAASCLPGATRALVELLAGPAGLKSGTPVEIGVHASRGIRGLRGVVNESGRATFSSQSSDLFWSTLQEGGAVTFSVEGRPAGFVESSPADRAITDFLAACR